MKERLNTTKALVRSILEQCPDARNSDMRLYYEVCNTLNKNVLEAPFAFVILKLDRFNLPPFESVRRARQKVQAEYPWLAASDEVELFRAENEEAYREFARGGA